MALGPQKYGKSHRLRKAEEIIDQQIREFGSDVWLHVPASMLPITEEDWKDLAPRYLEAGWKRADWVPDHQNGPRIELEIEN